MVRTFILLVTSVGIVGSCSGKKPSPAGDIDKTEQSAAAAAQTDSAETASTETDRLNQFFMEVFWRTVKRSPMIQGYLGFGFDKDKWDDISEARRKEDMELVQADLRRLRSDFQVASLDDQGKLSHRLFERRLQEALDDYEWRRHSYPITQMSGLHSQVPAFLSNFHGIDDIEDAHAYIARLRALPRFFKQLEENLVDAEKHGILPPRFVFPMVLEDCHNIITGAPFTGSAAESDSPVWADFKAKVSKIGTDDERERLLDAARVALETAVKPAYESLIATLERQQSLATTDDGVWKLPRGDVYYARQLRIVTTTDMSAEDIHGLGLREVARIHDEMRTIMQRVGFKGELAEFFTFMRTDEQFYFADSDAGRAEYLALATSTIKAMEARLDEVFGTRPKAALEVKRVEPYRENSAGLAFYNGPGLIGGRSGIYYVNLYDMSALPKYELEALAFHEGIPGHHMQNAIAIESEGLPMFRRFLGYDAYSEGWGLYSERLAKEMGFYEDPYSDLGRLSMELWRACRLVIDTGVHHRKWTRAQAIEWLTANTPGSKRDVRKAVERYIVMPGQATAYTIGMLEILRLRERARAALGGDFDLRDFHDVVLVNGSVPLPILGEQIDAYVRARGARSSG